MLDVRYRQPTDILSALLLSLFLGEKAWAQGMKMASEPTNRLASTPTLFGLAVFSVGSVLVAAVLFSHRTTSRAQGKGSFFDSPSPWASSVYWQAASSP